MEVFFYGLFMDVDILKENGVIPSNLRKGYLEDYGLRIGNRASLVPSANERAYGILMTVATETIQSLYSEPSVADYIQEEVLIVTDTNERISANCYNLPVESLTGTNASYAKSLLQLAKQLEFPLDYLEKIKKDG